MPEYPNPPKIFQQVKSRFTLNVQRDHDPPPPYKEYDTGDDVKSSWKKPKSWSRRRWLVVILIVIILIIVVVVAAVKGSQSNRYPDYSMLSYRLIDTYAGESFFDNFNYFSGYDPAQGFVHYADQSASAALNLTFASASTAILRVDMRDNVDTTTGRISARVESKATYNNGLFVFDVVHSPRGCSLWPALWLSNTYNWPADGEIDVMESANTATTGNQVTLHTTKGCTMDDVKRKQSGNTLHSNCNHNANDNAGCGVRGPTSTFGQEFNDRGGGIMALEWRDEGIRTWFFDRDSIPGDLTTDNMTSPDPSTWGEALADFPSTRCDIDQHFQNQSIIANIDLCGQMAGNEQYYTDESNCPGTCVDYVSQQPSSSYTEAYWEFGGFWAFQADGQ